MKTLRVEGRRWFNRLKGNTYYSARCYLDDKYVGGIDYGYGYDEQYLWDAFKWLEANGHITPPRLTNGREYVEAPWQWAERVGVKLLSSAVDVKRKKDL
jgi:hypothetical protein